MNPPDVGPTPPPSHMDWLAKGLSARHVQGDTIDPSRCRAQTPLPGPSMTASPNESSPTAAGTAPGATDPGASGAAGQLERYDVRSRLAVGGMAEVYLATARGAHGFEKTVALKRILPQLAVDSQFERRFIGEAKLAAKLSHANIVQVLDFGRYGGS